MVHSLHTTPAPEWPYYRYIKERQASSICGYVDGKSDSPILVPSGYVCSTDKSSAQFGICSTSGDGCHFPAACFDAHSCSDGCGQTNYRTIIECQDVRPSICELVTAGSVSYSDTCFTLSTTADWFGNTLSAAQHYCSSDLLIDAKSTTVTHIACGTNPGEVKTLLAVPESTPVSTTSSLPKSTIVATSSTRIALTSRTGTSLTRSISTSSSESTTGPYARHRNNGAIAGGTVGAIILVAAVAFVAFLIWRKRMHANHQLGSLPPGFQDQPELVGTQNPGREYAESNAFPTRHYADTRAVDGSELVK